MRERKSLEHGNPKHAYERVYRLFSGSGIFEPSVNI